MFPNSRSSWQLASGGIIMFKCLGAENGQRPLRNGKGQRGRAGHGQTLPRSPGFAG